MQRETGKRVVGGKTPKQSIQRNNQKLIEESPSPAVTPELRKALMDTAARAAKASGYVNAGTVEIGRAHV